MDCKDFEQSIYLYDELSASERRSVDAHLQTCASCAAVFEEVKGARLLINQMADAEIVPRNAAQLTSGIMSKIAAERSDRNSTFFAPFFFRARIALTVLSVVLLISFGVEFLRESTQLRSLQNFAASNSAVLNSKIFRDNFSQGKVKRSLFADCGSPLKMEQHFFDCVKSKLK
jgi:anti-sigma factor RsiW